MIITLVKGALAIRGVYIVEYSHLTLFVVFIYNQSFIDLNYASAKRFMAALPPLQKSHEYPKISNRMRISRNIHCLPLFARSKQFAIVR